MSTVEKHCPLLLFPLDSENTPKKDDLAKKLEEGTDDEKIEALKEIIHSIISGIDMSRLTMTVIKFCLRSKNHTIKRLLQIFWEVLDKKYPSGKLKEEMILVCNHLLNDLNHANEFIRGSTSRLLCRIHEAEILEQLVPQVLSNLEHRHSYVRKNSVLALMSIFTHHPDLVPDAPQRVYEFLLKEGNGLAKRNAFLMLSNCDLRNAIDFFLSVQDKITSFPETMQICILELMRKVCRTLPVPKSIFVKCSAIVLDSNNNAVVYEAANTLLSLTPLDSAVNRALEAYCSLLQTESDQNVKIIVINRLDSLKRRYSRNLRLVLMDILRALSTPNIDVRKKILKLTLDLSTNNNIEDIINVLKKEIVNTDNDNDLSGNNDLDIISYRNLLVETIHECAIKFPQVASNVVHLLMNYLGDENSQAAMDVITFVKEIACDSSDLRKSILEKLINQFNEIRNESVFRTALWILGEYCNNIELISSCINKLKEGIGPLPLHTGDENNDDINDDDEKNSNDKEDKQPTYVTRTVVSEDGTYVTETVQVSGNQQTQLSEEEQKSFSQFRIFLKSGEYYLATVLSTTLIKLMLKLKKLCINDNKNIKLYNELNAYSLLMLTSIIRYGLSNLAKKKIDNDTKSRMTFAIHTLLNNNIINNKVNQDIFLNKTKRSFGMMLKRKRGKEKLRQEKLKSQNEINNNTIEFDTLLNLRQLKGIEFNEFDEDDTLNIRKAAGDKNKSENLRTRLNRVHQLTGFSDNVYAEACVTVHQFDIHLDFLIINNTNKTLQNLNLELHTSGDLKLVEKPNKITLAGGESSKIQASIKVSSTENGVIFGNIVYDLTKATTDKNIVVMNCIHMDIMDYVHPSMCNESKFRDMWVEFEWENKVPVNTDIRDLYKYLKHVSNITNMKLLTPINEENKTRCQFLAANLHAKSIFGEHALMNVSIELKEEKDQFGKIKPRVTGHIRIRCKSQGIALSLGEKITNSLVMYSKCIIIQQIILYYI